MTPRKRVTADFWWRCATDALDQIISECLKKAKQASLQETGHDCGHEFTIRVELRGHSWGVTGEEPPVHSDSTYTDYLVPMEVRAPNLKAALLLAADRHIHEWFPEELEEVDLDV